MRLAAFLIALTLATPTLAQDKLTLILDWFVNPDHGPIVIAEEKGFFAEQGLEVEVIAPADPADPPKMAAAGKADDDYEKSGATTARKKAAKPAEAESAPAAEAAEQAPESASEPAAEAESAPSTEA